MRDDSVKDPCQVKRKYHDNENASLYRGYKSEMRPPQGISDTAAVGLSVDGFDEVYGHRVTILYYRIDVEDVEQPLDEILQNEYGYPTSQYDA